MPERADVLVIGSGVGGATLAEASPQAVAAGTKASFIAAACLMALAVAIRVTARRRGGARP